MRKTHKSSITVMVATYNEERNLKNTVEGLNKTLRGIFNDYEILIFDDCSTDRTGKIADELGKTNRKIRVFYNKKNMGLGYSYRRAVKSAIKEYFTWIPGDGEIEGSSIRRILENVGEADIIIPFTSNKEMRPLLRRLISSCYVKLLNLMFGLNLRYYLGIMVFKTKLIKDIKMKTSSFAFQLELLLPLIKRGHSYKEVPMLIKRTDKSRMLRLKNLIGIILTTSRLFFEIHFKKNTNLSM